MRELKNLDVESLNLVVSSIKPAQNSKKNCLELVLGVTQRNLKEEAKDIWNQEELIEEIVEEYVMQEYSNSNNEIDIALLFEHLGTRCSKSAETACLAGSKILSAALL